MSHKEIHRKPTASEQSRWPGAATVRTDTLTVHNISGHVIGHIGAVSRTEEERKDEETDDGAA